jgi:hypothetical protein
MLTADDINRIESRQARIEEKLDRLMAVFGLSDGQKKRLSRPEMDDIVQKGVLRFQMKQNKTLNGSR